MSVLSSTPPPALDEIQVMVQKYAHFSRSPYSKRQESAIVGLSDGKWVPGVRVESASFSLTVPPVVNAITTAFALRRTDVSWLVTSYPLGAYENAYLSELFGESMIGGSDWAARSDSRFRTDSMLEGIVGPQVPGPDEGIRRAREAASRATCPVSGFPVGAIFVFGEQGSISACNVELTSWPFILCAERNALSTAVSLGLTQPTEIYLSCPKEPGGTPCGACRQLLMEYCPDAIIYLDQGMLKPKTTSVKNLLPDCFLGVSLLPKE